MSSSWKKYSYTRCILIITNTSIWLCITVYIYCFIYIIINEQINDSPLERIFFFCLFLCICNKLIDEIRNDHVIRLLLFLLVILLWFLVFSSAYGSIYHSIYERLLAPRSRLDLCCIETHWATLERVTKKEEERPVNILKHTIMIWFALHFYKLDPTKRARNE